MKKFAVAALCVLCATAFVVKADDAKPEKKKGARKELVDKYDTNKDGKLDKEEIGKMSKEDKEKWDGMKKKKDAAK